MTSPDHAHSTVSVEQTLQPIPEEVRTHRVSGQFWIWCGANIAPINWVLGALGIALGLGLRDTLIVLVAGQPDRNGRVRAVRADGPAHRGDGHGVVPGGVRPARRLPAGGDPGLLAVGWCAVNTWIILDLVMALLGKIGLVDPAADNYGWKILVAAVIMVIQVAISWAGYRAIATFERWTVPPTIVVLIAMSVVAWTQLDIDWGYAGPAGAGADRHRPMGRDERCDDGHRHRLGHHLVHLRRRLLPLRQPRRAAAEALRGKRSRPVHPGGLARRPRCHPGHEERVSGPRRAHRRATSARWRSPCCCSSFTAPSRPTS